MCCVGESISEMEDVKCCWLDVSDLLYVYEFGVDH